MLGRIVRGKCRGGIPCKILNGTPIGEEPPSSGHWSAGSVRQPWRKSWKPSLS
jgi:hypothetical protein